MHCSKSARECLRTSPVPGLVLLALVLLPAPQAPAASFEIHDVQTRLVDGVYQLDADLGLELSAEALEALDNGVALTVVVDMQVRRSRKYVWDEKVASLESRHRLRLHPLSSQYVLRNLDSGVIRTFGTLDEALAALGTVVDFPLLDAHLLEAGEAHQVRIRSRLDINALPAPLRLLAYVTPEWRLSSGWTQWPLQP